VKKLNVILLILSFILSGIGSIFLFDATNTTNNTIQTVAPSNKIESEEITEYTYKTYEDYFIDNFNLPAETYTRDETTGKVTISYSQIARKTINGETELSYNGNTFYTISNDDLTGSGTEVDPYVVNSTKGFLYISNASLFSLNQNTYVELNTNIILNDETFNQEGDAFGGDGIVYVWQYRSWRLCHFDGCGKTIFGAYYMYSSYSSFVGVFRDLREIKNLTLESIFMTANHAASGFGHYIYKIINCNIKDSFIISTGEKAYGFTCSVPGGFEFDKIVVESCKNLNTTIKAKSGAAGICGKALYISNCINYGNVYANSNAAGISDHGATKISNCINYGKIVSTNDWSYSSGITSNPNFSSSSIITIINCINHGEIHGINGVGGILGNTYVSIDIINCENHGKIKSSGSTYGEIVGRLNCPKTKMIDCKVYSESLLPIWSRAIEGVVDVYIDEFQYFNKNKRDNKSLTLFPNIQQSGKFTLKNSFFSISNSHFKLGGYKNFEILNIIVKNTAQNGQNSIVDNDKISRGYIKILGGLIYITKDSKFYYGSGFSGFYYSWRTGKVGLVALDGRGQFQGVIDEEWLKNNGYTKKSA